ncbi:MAG: PepSY domain-containing protein [Clostridium sp.]|nr:PepSY domain-containing protein [Clostridium sp.]MCM1547382.1 PepSY domain-containing protein [Ruminococcus sp.]
MKTKKAVITAAAVIASVAVIGGISVFAVYKTAESRAIGEAKAEQIALADSGVSVSEARFRNTEFNFDDGHFVYDVEFYTDSGEYDYTISAKNGEILERDADIIKLPGSVAADTATDAPINAPTDSDSKNADVKVEKADYIGIDRAEEIALANSGLKETDVTFTKSEIDRDNDVDVYEIEFYSGMIEYEYKLLASDGSILEYDAD